MTALVKSACVMSILFVSMTLSFHVPADVDAATGHQSGEADRVYFQDGDVILGGVFPLHSYDEGKRACSIIREVRALKLVEAMVYAVGRINNSTDLLPGIQLGFEIYDSCYSDIWTLKKALNFLPPDQKRACKGSWGSGEERVGTGDLTCLHQKRIAGVVGSQRSQSSIELALLLGLYHIPQVSYLSTLDSLSEVNYPYFLRVVPSDRHQVNAIMDLVQHYGWTYVSLLFSDDEYGENGYYEFTRQAADHNVCLAYTKEISFIFPDTYFDDIVADMRREPFNRAVVVVLFAHLFEARKLLEAVERGGAVGEFTFIASDGIGNFGRKGLDGLEKAALGMITMVPYSQRFADFNDFFIRNLSPNNSNPWAAEYMDAYTWCEFLTGNICAVNRTDSISPHETLVIDSVYAFAYALDSMLSKQCGSEQDWGSCTAIDNIDGQVLLSYLKQTDYQSLSNGHVTFDNNGDGIPRYKIRNLNNELFGWPTFVDVGSWREYDDVIDINNDVRFYTKDVGGSVGGVPSSVCSEPCPVGSRKHFFEDEVKCCWLCVECEANATVVKDDTECRECVPPEWPDANRTECVPVAASFMSWGSVEGTVVNIMVSVGVLEALLVLVFYFPQLRRRIVRRSDPMLCMFIHLGVCFLLVAALSTTFEPTPAMCVLMRMGPSVAYSLIFVPFAMKSARLYRVFIKARDTDSEEEADLWGIKRQLLILAIIWIIEVGVSLAWILVFPPEVSYTFVPIDQPTGGALAVTLLITCNFKLHETITEMCFGVFFLLVAVTLSLLARALPDNYHEARFCVFASAGSLLVFTGAYAADFGTSQSGASFLPIMYRALGMLTTSILIMTCLFAPKMYVIYFVRGNIDEVMLKKRQSVANMAAYRTRASTVSTVPAMNGGPAGRRRSRVRSTRSSSEPASSSGDHGIQLKAISTSII
ncbi:metabotropic glutamate receptor-like [Patiria miniata]|uniref:G-protein coupled receptors family 3 profile domain-containing protein n=1 Tax=Patiria miniata TaxID=46514 RepID=A0A914A8B6_PATMI|nr:metabotropic glutamate receptor-like [Patiria miniata]